MTLQPSMKCAGEKTVEPGLCRREFLRASAGTIASLPAMTWAWSGTTLALLGALASGCAAGLPVYRGQVSGSSLVIPRSVADPLLESGAMLVRAPELPRPIAVRRLDDGSLLALSTTCTHLGCEVRVLQHGFECPCHGSAYAPDGAVRQGPATRPLLRYPIRETEESIVMDVE